MKNSGTKGKICAVLLALLTAVPALWACADKNGPAVTSDGGSGQAEVQSTAEATTGEISTELNAMNLLGPRDFGGEKTVFYSRNYSGEWTSDLMYETTTGEIVPDAVAARNMKIEEQYKTDLQEKKSGSQSFYTNVQKELAAGDPGFDVLYTSIRDASSLSTSGYLIELGSVPHLSLYRSWWSPFLSEQLSIAGKKYYATGEITTVDDISIRAVFFNKELLKAIDGSEDLYARVDNDDWTFDDMFRLVNAALVDVGNDGKIELGNDTIGLLAEGTLGYQLLMGTGEKIIGKDGEDKPYISVTESRPVDVVDKLTSLIAGNASVQTGSSVYIPFAEGKILFALVTIVRENSLKNYEIDFGIVPYPKYNKDQEKFHCYSDAYCPNAISFPFGISQDALDRGAFICEALAVESVNTVTPAFYDVCMKTRYSRDARMGDMLDVIRDDYQIDLADVFLNVWGLRTPVTNAISAGKSLSSALKSITSGAQRKIDQTTKAIEDLDH